MRAPSALVERARCFLAQGPADSTPLIEYACHLPGAPVAVAEQMAVALLGDADDIVRGPDGRWMLVQAELPWGDRTTNFRAVPTKVKLLESVSFVVVDVETTGGSPESGDRITEIGAVTVQGAEIRDTWETLVDPQRPIPPVVTALTRITSDMVRGKPTFEQVSGKVAEVLAGKVFVAHNAIFDWRFIRAELGRSAGHRLVGERLCTVRLARAVLPHLRRRSLDSLSNHFGISNHARHRALGDALATARVLLRLLNAARESGCLTLEDVRQLMRRPVGKRGRRRRRPLPGWSDGETTA